MLMGKAFDFGIQENFVCHELRVPSRVCTEGDSKVAHWVTFILFFIIIFLGGIWMALI